MAEQLSKAVFERAKRALVDRFAWGRWTFVPRRGTFRSRWDVQASFEGAPPSPGGFLQIGQ